MPLIGRHPAGQCIAIDILDGDRATALGNLERLFQQRQESRPRRVEAGINAARSPFFGALANLVRREEP